MYRPSLRGHLNTLFVRLKKVSVQQLYLILERPPVYGLECNQFSKGSRFIDCHWQIRQRAQINIPHMLTVSDFTGHEKEWHMYRGLSASSVGGQLRYNVAYNVRLGRAWTTIILHGTLLGLLNIYFNKIPASNRKSEHFVL